MSSFDDAIAFYGPWHRDSNNLARVEWILDNWVSYRQWWEESGIKEFAHLPHLVGLLQPVKLDDWLEDDLFPSEIAVLGGRHSQEWVPGDKRWLKELMVNEQNRSGMDYSKKAHWSERFFHRAVEERYPIEVYESPFAGLHGLRRSRRDQVQCRPRKGQRKERVDRVLNERITPM